jgi:ATP-dependent Clp protease ATP-binding subunit ClpA
MEDSLGKRVVGQAAVHAVATAVRGGRVGPQPPRWARS